MRDLARGVHSGVGATGDHQPDRFPEEQRECVAEDAGDGAQSGLHGPAGELRPVVGEVEAEPEGGGAALGHRATLPIRRRPPHPGASTVGNASGPPLRGAGLR